jgi:hypothetical protein
MGTNAATKAAKSAAPKVSMTHYNRAVRTARTAAQRAGQAAWIIGDAALSVATEYGENTLKRFADDIEVEAATVRAYRTMAAKYPADVISRELQSPTVYGIFASQDDAHDLVSAGNGGKAWTVSAARALVQSRNSSDVAGDGNVSDGSGDEAGEREPADELAVAEAEVMRLEGELARARAKVAKIRAERGITDEPATDEPATATAPKAAPKRAPKAAPKVTAPAPDLAGLLAESVAAAPAVRATRTARAARRAAQPATVTAPKVTAPKVTAPKAAPKTAPKTATVARHMVFRGVPEHDAGTRPNECVSCKPAGRRVISGAKAA